MAEPENHTLRLLQDIRRQGEETRADLASLRSEMADGFARVDKRLDSMHRAINGESVLGRYAAAEVEERLTAIEGRLSALESQHE